MEHDDEQTEHIVYGQFNLRDFVWSLLFDREISETCIRPGKKKKVALS